MIAGIVAYLVAMLAVGAWAARRTRTEEDFFVAGRRAGLLATGLATMAASFSSFVFLGGPGLTYRAGLGSMLIVLPVGFTAGLLCRTVGTRLRALAGEGVMTVPGALAERYPGRAVPALAAVAILLGTIAYLGLQLQGVSVILRTVVGVERPDVALAIGLAVVLGYSVVGGMVAGLYTDVVQGVLMLVAAVAVFVRALDLGGGFGAIGEAVAGARGPQFLEPGGSLALPTLTGFFFVFGVGVLGQPHLLHKFFMIRDARKLRFLPLVFGGSQIACLAIWIGVGLGVPALVAAGRIAPLANPDDATPVFLLAALPAPLAALLVAGLLAAVMSTADSFLNIGAAALVRDLPRTFGRPLRRELAAARVAVVFVAAAATWFSRMWADLIALVGTFAFGVFAAALAPALVLGLWWKRVRSSSAAASITTGLVVGAGLEFLARQSWFPSLPRPPLVPGALPSAVALAASFLVLVLTSAVGGADPVERRAVDVDRNA